jgi:hypothetical protein
VLTLLLTGASVGPQSDPTGHELEDVREDLADGVVELARPVLVASTTGVRALAWLVGLARYLPR